MQSSSRRLVIFAVAGVSLLACATVIALAIMFSGTVLQKPGEGKKAEQGYALAAPVITALESYHDAEGHYPTQLIELLPDYLTDLPKQKDGTPLEYAVGEKSYRLQFSYTKPGFNTCTYRPEVGWECHGYY